MRKHQNIYYYFILTIISISFPLYYGNQGVFPIDSFLIFNGGYNVLNGHHPFKDYWSITGPLLDYLQKIFFIFGGINWLSYVAHAVFINLILCLFSFYFFLKFSLDKIYSFIYALGIAILGYSQTGTPFMDHHAFMFSYISLCFLLLGVKLKKNIYWLFSGFFIVFSFLSKQVPSAYFLIFLILFSILYLFFFKKNYKNILSIFTGGLFASLIFLLIFILNDVPLNNFLIQYIFYPMTIGQERSEILNFDLKNTIFQFKFMYFAAIPYFIIFFSIIKSKINKHEKQNEILIFLIIFSMFSIFIYSQLMTKNQILIFFTIPFFVSISHLYVDKLKKNKKIILIFLISIFLISTTKYHFRFNEEKKFMELAGSDIKSGVEALQLDNKLSPLKWITPKFNLNPQEEINLLLSIKKILLKEKKEFILITDYQILPALLSNSRVAPNKWYDSLSVPNQGNAYFEDYVAFSKNAILREKIKKVFIIDSEKRFIEELYLGQNCIDFKKINPIAIEATIERCIN